MVFPIAEREMIVAARRPATYRGRMMAACTGLVITAWKAFSFSWQGMGPGSQGRSLFLMLSWVSFLYCLFVGARLTADCLSREKREGNLGLLFLTDLKPWDVVFGKLVANSVNSAYGLMAFLPVLALPLLLGGVTLFQFLQVGLVLLNTLFFSLATGLFVSSISRNDRKAMMGTMLVLVTAIMAPAGYVIIRVFVQEAVANNRDLLTLVNWLLIDPIYGLFYVFPPAVPGVTLPSWSFWASLLAVHALGWLQLALAIIVLPHVWKDRTPIHLLARLRALWERWSLGTGAVRETFRVRWLARNPYLWLVIRDRLKPAYTWVFLGSMIVIWLWGYWQHRNVMFDFYPLIPTIILVHGFLKVWVLAEACHRLVEDQRNGALELILVTPLTIEKMVDGQFLAIRRQFAWPMMVLALLEIAMFFQWYSMSMILASLTMLVADIITMVWVGMHLSLSSKSVNRVMVSGVALVLLLPWATSVVFAGLWQWMRLNWFNGENLPFESRVLLWFVVGLLTDLILIFGWARPRLSRRSRPSNSLPANRSTDAPAGVITRTSRDSASVAITSHWPSHH